MILCGSAAHADVSMTIPRFARIYQFSPALASSLALPPQQVTRETPKLHAALAREAREARATAAERRSWSKRRAAARPISAAPAPTSQGSAPAPVVHYTADWYGIAACESGGVWSINSGNGYWGGLQFSHSTWFAYGGGPFDGVGPFPYSAAQQIAVAERVLADQGPGAWPNCFRWA